MSDALCVLFGLKDQGGLIFFQACLFPFQFWLQTCEPRRSGFSTTVGVRGRGKRGGGGTNISPLPFLIILPVIADLGFFLLPTQNVI